MLGVRAPKLELGAHTDSGYSPLEGFVMIRQRSLSYTCSRKSARDFSIRSIACRCGIAHTHMTYSYNAVARGRRVGEGSGEVASKTRLSSGFYSALRKQ